MENFKFIIMAFVFVLLSCSEEFESKFNNYDEAKESGLVDKGWIPDILDHKSIFNFTEKHDIENNRVWIVFDFVGRDMSFLQNATYIHDRNAQSISMIFNKNFNINNSELKYFEYSSKEYIAVDTVNCKGYYYRESSY